jgi:hypothetical protein
MINVEQAETRGGHGGPLPERAGPALLLAEERGRTAGVGACRKGGVVIAGDEDDDRRRIAATRREGARLQGRLQVCVRGCWHDCLTQRLFRRGSQVMSAFSLPWYAIVGAQKGGSVGLPVWGCVGSRSSGRPPAATTATSRPASRQSSSSAANGSSAPPSSPRSSGSSSTGRAGTRGSPWALRLRSPWRSGCSRSTAAGRSRSRKSGRRRHPRRSAPAPRPQARREVAARAARPGLAR